MSSAYENAMSDLQANNATQKYPVGTNDIGMSLDDYSEMIARAEAAEARAAELIEANREQAEAIATLRTERDALHADMVQCVSDARKMAADLYRAQNERDKLARQLEQVQRTLKAIDRIHSEAFNEGDGVYRP